MFIIIDDETEVCNNDSDNCIYEDAFRSIDQVTIGLFFINFNFVFYKEVA